MNKIFNVNLGGLPFSIDDNAFEVLNNYLRTLRQHFSQSDDCDEIIGDIESRLAELISTSLGSKGQIVGLRDVQNAIATMGTPEDFGIETSDNQSYTHQKNSGTEGGQKRRLFRDPDDKSLSGVCGGLTAYFGLRDASWLRLAFLLTTLAGGTGIFVYIVLWIVMPVARTSTDRLAMRGEPINVDNIARTIEESATRLGDRISEFDKSGKISRSVQRLGDFISNLIINVVNIIKKISGGILFVLLALIVVCWLAGIIAIFLISPFFSYLVPDSQWQAWLFGINVFFAVLIPTVSIVLFLIRLFYGKKVPLVWTIAMWVVWFANMSIAASLVTNFSTQFNHNSQETQSLNYTPLSDTLTLVAMQHPNGQLKIELDNIYISKEYLLCRDIFLKVEPTTNPNYSLEIKKESQGNTPTEAKNLAATIQYLPQFSQDSFRYWEAFEVTAGTRWRGQHINMVLKMPIGKKIKLKNPYQIIYDSYEEGLNDTNVPCFDNESAEYGIFEMTTKGLICGKSKSK